MMIAVLVTSIHEHPEITCMMLAHNLDKWEITEPEITTIVNSINVDNVKKLEGFIRPLKSPYTTNDGGRYKNTNRHS